MEDILKEHCRALEERIDSRLDKNFEHILQLREELSDIQIQLDKRYLVWKHNLILSALAFFLGAGLALYFSIKGEALSRVDVAVNTKLDSEILIREERFSESLADEEKRVRSAQSALDEIRANLAGMRASAEQLNMELIRVQVELSGTDLVNYKLVREVISKFHESVDELVTKIAEDPGFKNSVLDKAGALEENSLVVFHQDNCPSLGWAKSSFVSDYGEGTVVCEKSAYQATSSEGSSNE